MAIETYNPTDFIGQTFTDGLDYMIANVPASPTYSDIVDTVVAYYNSISGGSLPPAAINGITGGLNNGANDYINQKIGQQLNFDANGMALIDSTLCGIKENTIDSLDNFFTAALEQIALSNVNSVSKSSLYGALTLAQKSNTYWNNIVTTPGSWSTYLNAEPAINYANIPAWVTASYVGAFSGFAEVQAPNMPEANVDNGQNRLNALSGAVVVAIGITSAQVILKWAKRPVVGNFPSVDSMLKGGGGSCGCHNF